MEKSTALIVVMKKIVLSVKTNVKRRNLIQYFSSLNVLYSNRVGFVRFTVVKQILILEANFQNLYSDNETITTTPPRGIKERNREMSL